MLTKEKIQQILQEKFHPIRITVTDDSHSHADHNPSAAGGGTHFSVEIVSPVFTGKKLIERHRMVYSVLEEALKTQIHALAIKAISPEEE
jgi:BolA protein